MISKIALIDPVRTAKAFLLELDRRKVDYVVVDTGLVGGVREPLPAAELAAELRRQRVTQVISCCDPSIVYADSLCAQLGVPFNGLRLSTSRSNKVLMNEVVRSAGLRAPNQISSDRVEVIQAWAPTVGFPVVVKPANSGGTDNVYRCASEQEIEQHFATILGKKNLMGSTNTVVLAQEYIDGTEFSVNCVSFSGTHICTDVLEYQKGTHNNRAFVYEKVRFVRAEDPRAKRLMAFARQALDALDFRTGASHMEIKLTSGDELVFIEVGARLMGAELHDMVRDARSDQKTQIELAVDAALGLPAPVGEYETSRDALRVWLVSKEEGRLKRFVNIENIESLRSYRRKHLVAAGQDICRTTDLTNAAGFIELAHSDPRTLREDEKYLDQILATGVIELE